MNYELKDLAGLITSLDHPITGQDKHIAPVQVDIRFLIA
jgi:hypothetical protein